MSEEAFEMRETCHVKSHAGMFPFTYRRWSVEVLLSLNLFEFAPNHNLKLFFIPFTTHTLSYTPHSQTTPYLSVMLIITSPSLLQQTTQTSSFLKNGEYMNQIRLCSFTLHANLCPIPQSQMHSIPSAFSPLSGFTVAVLP